MIKKSHALGAVCGATCYKNKKKRAGALCQKKRSEIRFKKDRSEIKDRTSDSKFSRAHTMAKTHNCNNCNCEHFPICRFTIIDSETGSIDDVLCMCIADGFPTLQKLCINKIVQITVENIKNKKTTPKFPLMSYKSIRLKEKTYAPDLTEYRTKITELEGFSMLPRTLQYELLKSSSFVPRYLADYYECRTCKLVWYTEMEECNFCHFSKE